MTVDAMDMHRHILHSNVMLMQHMIQVVPAMHRHMKTNNVPLTVSIVIHVMDTSSPKKQMPQ